MYEQTRPSCDTGVLLMQRKGTTEEQAHCLACNWNGLRRDCRLKEVRSVEQRSYEPKVEEAAKALHEQLFWQGDGRALRYIKDAMRKFVDAQHAVSIPADVPRYWVMRYHLTNEKSSAEVSHKEDAVCVVMVDELHAAPKPTDVAPIPFVPDPQNDAIEVATIVNVSDRVIRVIMKADFAVTVEVMRCEMGAL